MGKFTPEQLSQLTDDQLFELRAELLKGLDDDLAGGSIPQTLAVADRLAEQLPGRLFEEDNGYFDFNSPLTEESLQATMADLRINFSREKLEFACKVIASLNGSKTVAAPVEAAPSVETPAAPDISKEPLPVEEPELGSPSTKTSGEPSKQGGVPRPKTPDAKAPSGWTKPKPGANNGGEKTTRPPRGASSGSKVPTRKIGFFEGIFGSVGRRIDEFFARLFG